jgi:hypothetical protein
MRAKSCTLANVAPRSTIISAARCCRRSSGLVLLLLLASGLSLVVPAVFG